MQQLMRAGAGAALMTLFLVQAAGAAPVTARSTASWENPQPDEASQTYARDYLETMNAGEPESWMSWGAPCIGTDCALPSASGASRLSYRGTEATGGYGELLPIGAFTFENGDNYTNTQFAQVDFILHLVIETPGGVFAEDLPIALAVVNTPNRPGRESDWPDYLDFRVAGGGPLEHRLIGSDGALYAIRVRGFSAIESLRVDEGESASATVLAQVGRELRPIPSPGGFGLLVFAVLLLIGSARVRGVAAR